MCLGVPGKIIEIKDHFATVEFWGVRREIRIDVVDEPVEVGDYVLNHAGFAIRRIPTEAIEETLALYEELMELAEEEDLMAADIRSEIAATRGGGNGTD